MTSAMLWESIRWATRGAHTYDRVDLLEFREQGQYLVFQRKQIKWPWSPLSPYLSLSEEFEKVS